MSVYKKIILTLCATATISLFMTGCLVKGSSSSTPVYFKPTSASEVDEDAINKYIDDYNNDETIPSSPLTEKYQNIYNEFSEALMSENNININDIKSELNYYEQLDALIAEKSSELEMLLSEATDEFASIYRNSENASTEEYEFWLGRLNKVYEKEISELESTFDYNEDDENRTEDFDY